MKSIVYQANDTVLLWIHTGHARGTCFMYKCETAQINKQLQEVQLNQINACLINVSF